MLLQTAASGKLRVALSYSEDVENYPDRVRIEADLITQERDDALMEQIVSRLSLEPGVIATRWRIIEQEFG
jgi:hypothetical protein